MLNRTKFKNLQTWTWLAGHKLQTLLDTGASITCAAARILPALSQAMPGFKLQPWPDERKVSAADGNALFIVGWTMLPVRLRPEELDTDITVVFIQDLAYDLLLGTDAIQALRLTIDFDHNKLRAPCTTRPGKKFAVTFNVTESVSSIGLAEHQADLDDRDLPEPPVAIPEPLLIESLNEKANDMSIPAACKEEFKVLLVEFADLFTASNKAGMTTVIEHRIETGDAAPVSCGLRSYNPKLREVMHEQVQSMLKDDIIEVAATPWKSPVVLVKKKNGAYRFAIDYRKLNNVTVKDSYPIQSIRAILDSMHGAKIFSSLDLCQGYFQVPVAEKDRDKTGFITPDGCFRFKRMPFGVCNGPATFSRLMNQVLAGLDNVLVYLDDIIIFSPGTAAHLKTLELLFQRLRQAELTINLLKCRFFQAGVPFLGHIVSGAGLETEAAKVKKLCDMPAPIDVSSVRRFVGLASYYRRFVQNFADIAKPLTDLTKGNATFVWSSDCAKAFETLKAKLTSAPVLSFPDFAKEFTVECDASDVGLGATLSQQDADAAPRVIAFASRALAPRESNYSATERELLALIWSTRHFAPYLMGTHFNVITDHQALKWLNVNKDTSPRLARWLMSLQDLDFSITYRPGKDNGPPDALSRDLPDIRNAAQLLRTTRATAKLATNNVAVLTRSGKARAEKRPMLQASSADSAAQPSSPSDVASSSPERTVVQQSSEHQSQLAPAEQPIPAKKSATSAQAELRQSDEEEGLDVEIAHAPATSKNNQLAEAQKTDPIFGPVIDYLQHSKVPLNRQVAVRVKKFAERFQFKNDVLYKVVNNGQTVEGTTEFRIAVPRTLRYKVLQECHDSSQAGHFGQERTIARVQARYWWPSMTQDCIHWVESCQLCNQRKQAHGKGFGELQPIVPGGTFGMLGMDFVGPLHLTSRGNKFLLVCTLYAERWAFAFALPDSTAQSVARVLVEQIFPTIGAVDKLLTDQGQAFVALLLKEICDLLRIQKVTTSSYHPQCNGLTERLNATLVNALAKLVDSNQSDWDVLVPHVTFAYNSTTQKSLGTSPYFLMFGREPKWPSEFESTPRFALTPPFRSAAEFRAKFAEHLKTAREVALESLAQAQLKQSTQYNRSHRPHPFALHDQVLLQLPHATGGHHDKLSRKWSGPFRIVALSDSVARLRDESAGKVAHRTLAQRVHVSRLKLFVPRQSQFDPP